MYKKIIMDFLLNISASMIPLFLLQFLLLPQVAKGIGAEEYGFLISVIAFINLISSAFGSSLNNSRLITYNIENNIENRKNHSIIFLFFSILTLIIVVPIIRYMSEDFNSLTLILLVFTSVLMLYRTYNIVEFRIELNYFKIVITSLFLVSGYITGFIIFYFNGNWVYIYFLGLLFSSIYIALNIRVQKNNLNKGSSLKATVKNTTILLLSGLLASTVIYVDKLLLYPLLGGYLVTIYYVSTLLGKTISSVIEPINSVLLSYFSKMKKFNNKHFAILMLLSSIVGIISYIGIIIITKPILSLLYPQYLEESLIYVPITTLTIIVMTLGNVVNTVILKFRRINLQIYINVIYTIMYILLAISFLHLNGLYGFCIGILIASSLRFVILIMVYFVKK